MILKKNEILEQLKKVKNNDLKDLVYRMRLSYDEIMDILDLKYIPTKSTGYSLNPGIYEVIDQNNTLKYILPDNVKVSVTIDFLLCNFRFHSITFLSARRYRWVLSIDSRII